MAATPNRSVKSKVTVSLDTELLKRVDKILPKGQSRSKIVEQALRKLVSEFTRYKIEEEVEQYYLSLSEAEKEEDRDWNRIAAESAKGFWEKE